MAVEKKATVAKKETVAKVAAPAAEAAVAAKKAEVPAVEKKETEKSAPKKRGRKPGTKNAEKATKTDKKTTKTAKKVAPVERTTEVHIQFDYREDIVTNEIVAKIEDAFKEEGHRVSTIKSLNVYVNVAENKAYYVINGKEEGKFVEL